MPNAGRAALLAALTVIGFACSLLLLSLLIRCAVGDEGPMLTPETPSLTPGTPALTPEVPVTTSEVPKGCSPYTGPAAGSRRPGPMAQSLRPEPAAGPLRPAPGGALPDVLVVASALPQGKDVGQVPAEHPARTESRAGAG